MRTLLKMGNLTLRVAEIRQQQINAVNAVLPKQMNVLYFSLNGVKDQCAKVRLSAEKAVLGDLEFRYAVKIKVVLIRRP